MRGFANALRGCSAEATRREEDADRHGLADDRGHTHHPAAAFLVGHDQVMRGLMQVCAENLVGLFVFRHAINMTIF